MALWCRYWKGAVRALVGVGIFLFWSIPYRSALNFQEQFQLFLVDGDDFWQHVTTRGGLAVWLAEALVQFYNNYWLGAAILACELMAIQWLSWKILRRIFLKEGKEGRDKWLFLVSFIPMGAVWLKLGDVNMLHSLLIAVIEELALFYLLTAIFTTKKIKRRSVRTGLAAVSLPLCVALYLWTAGTNHYRSKTQEFSWENVFDSESYELLDYDLLVRMNDWDGIIRKAEQKKPETAMSIAATNLALGMKGQLGARASEFPQPSREGLVPSFRRESFSTMTTAEIYYQLGLINTAQRLCFEAMEGLPNYKKSCRCIRRLAETNMINGQYDVARKYLRLLQKTVFYKLWATKTLKLIDSGEEAINNHPLYGRMRRIRLTEDFLFFEKEMDMVCGRLFLENRNNSLATQYMLMFPLLENDVEKFVKYLKIVDDYLPDSWEAASFRKYLPQ